MSLSHKWVPSYNYPHPGKLFFTYFYFKEKVFLCALLLIFGAFLFVRDGIAQAPAQNEPQTIKMRVVAVNPSADKEQAVPVKIYLPEEVTPKDIINSRDLEVAYDDKQSMYYAYKDDVLLRPKETRVFEIEVNDVWLIPQKKLSDLKDQTAFILKRLEGSDFYEASKVLSDAINDALNVIASTQSDETVSRKQHIGIYRNNIKLLEEVKENIERLERQLTLASALPVPEVLEKKEVKSESPTKTTTWMIIFIIIVFMGMLAGVFFFTWHAQARSTREYISDARKSVFKKDECSP